MDEINAERLKQITMLVMEAIANCETCRTCDDNPGCARCASFKKWLATA